MSSAALRSARAASTAELLGMSPDVLGTAVSTAFLIWRMRYPWKLLPRRAQPWVFEKVGARFAERVVVRWTDGR